MTTRPIFVPVFVGRVAFETNQINVLHVGVNFRPVMSKINAGQYKFRVDLYKIDLNPVTISANKSINNNPLYIYSLHFAQAYTCLGIVLNALCSKTRKDPAL